MSASTSALWLADDSAVDFTLEQILLEGAPRALQKAIEDEVAQYIQAHQHSMLKLSGLTSFSALAHEKRPS